jgi:hypothetical protein
VDERVVVDRFKDCPKIEVKGEIVTDEFLIFTLVHEGRAFLSAPDHLVPYDPAPPAIAPSIPAEDLSAPQSLVKGERLIRAKGDPWHGFLVFPLKYLRFNLLEYGQRS